MPVEEIVYKGKATSQSKALVVRSCAVCGRPFAFLKSQETKKNPYRCCNRNCGYLFRRLLDAPRRFWQHVTKKGPDECWIFKQGERRGYFAIDGKSEPAARIAYQLAKGIILDGLWVLHKCDNPPCCNPAHLFLGTPQDNMDDKMRKGRWRGRYSK
jgi:hypothetical protein